MIDIATWRARIGLHRVCVGPSGRRAKVLRPDGASWSLLLALTTITIEVVVTVIILLVLSSGGQYHYIPQPAASLVNPGMLEKSLVVKDLQLGLSSEVVCNYCVQPVASSLIAIPSLETSGKIISMTYRTLIIPVLYLMGIITSFDLGREIQLMFSDDTTQQYCIQPVTLSLVKPVGLMTTVNGNTTHHLRAGPLIPVLYSKGVVSRTKLMLSGDVEKNPGPGKVADDNSAVYEVFRAHFNQLVEAMTSPRTLIPVLYAKDLISKNDKTRLTTLTQIDDIERATIILNAVQIKIESATKAALVVIALCEAVNDEPALRLVANRITAALDQPAPPPTISPAGVPHTPAIQNYIDYLKTCYIHNSPELKETFKVQLKDFIHLNLVSNEEVEEEEDDEFKSECLLLQLYGDIATLKMKKRPMEMEDIGRSENQSVVRHILVEGSPGIGKTMLSWELCRQWAEGKMLQDRDIVVMLQLRKSSVREAKNLSDLFYMDNNTIKQEVLDYITRVHGRGVLFLLEGYDELSADHRTDGGILNQLLIGKCLPRATIMVTSRPLASDSLCCEFKNSIDQHIEVVGFKDNDIKAYVELACQKRPKILPDFKSYIESNPFVSSIMYIPLQCAIITRLYIEKWRDNKGKAYAPTTLTQLYTDVLLNSLIRYINDHPVHSKCKKTITKLLDLPSVVQEQFWKLSQLAAEGLEKKKFIFDSIPCDHMGLMQRAEEELTIGSTVSYCFLHLTLQEYLAALHWSRMDSEDMVRLVNETSLFPLDTLVRDGITTGYFWPALYFLSGLTKLSFVPTERLNKSLKAADKMMNDEDNLGNNIGAALEFFDIDFVAIASTMSKKKCNPYFFQMLFETQSHELTTRIFRCESVIPTITNPLECFVTAWCVANSDPKSQWSLRFESISMLKKFVQHFEKFVGSNKSYGSVTWIWLTDIHQEYPKPELGRSLSSLFPSLEGLALIHMTLESIKQIFPFLNSVQKLKALAIYTYRAEDELPAAVSLPELHCPTLKNVWFHGTGSGSLIPSLVLPNINTLVVILFMRRCRQISEFSKLCTALRQSTSLECFCWNTANLNRREVNELVSALEQIRSLKVVKYNDLYMLTDLGFKHVLQTINSIGISVGKEQIEDILHKFFSPIRSLPQLVPVDVPSSYNHLAEIEEQNNEDYRSLSLVHEAENHDESLKLVLPILASLQREKRQQREKREQRKRTATTDARQKALKSMKI